MATANDADLITCGVCFYEYHEKTRSPKFLPCFHTICLPCLLAIFKDGAISCPLCRNVSNYENAALVEKLQTNSHALHILELNKRITTYELDQCWCFSCGFKAQASCPIANHSVLNLASDTIKNLNGFFNLREEFQVTRNKEKENLNKTLEKINQIQKHLEMYSEAVKSAKEEILELQDENNLFTAKTMSKLSSFNETLQGGAKTDFQNEMSQVTESFLAEATSHVKNSNSEEMVTSIQEKWKKSLELSKETLDKMTDVDCEYERRKKMRITVKIFDENDQPIPTCPLLENGFTLSTNEDPLVFQNKVFLSYAVFSLMRKDPAVDPVDSECSETDVEEVNDEEVYFNIEDNEINQSNEPEIIPLSTEDFQISVETLFQNL